MPASRTSLRSQLPAPRLLANMKASGCLPFRILSTIEPLGCHPPQHARCLCHPSLLYQAPGAFSFLGIVLHPDLMSIVNSTTGMYDKMHSSKIGTTQQNNKSKGGPMFHMLPGTSWIECDECRADLYLLLLPHSSGSVGLRPSAP